MVLSFNRIIIFFGNQSILSFRNRINTLKLITKKTPTSEKLIMLILHKTPPLLTLTHNAFIPLIKSSFFLHRNPQPDWGILTCADSFSKAGPKTSDSLCSSLASAHSTDT